MRTAFNTFWFLTIFLSVAMLSYAKDGDKGRDRGRSGGGGGSGRGQERSVQRAQRAQQRAANRPNVRQRDNRPNVRSPSMSRDSGRRQQQAQPQVQRQARQQRQANQQARQAERQAGQSRPQVQSQQFNRDQARQRWAQNRREQGARRQQQVNQQTTARKADDFKKGHKDRWDKDRKFSHDTSRHLKRRYPHYHDWFYNHDWHPRYWSDNVNWWRRPYWNNVYTWLGWGPSYYPIYYDNYGYPIQLNYDVSNYDQSYIDNSVYPSTYQQPVVAAPVQGDWLPLGVFAVGSTPQEAAYSTIFMQLAINKQGDIAGTYYNSATGQSFEMDGDIDPQTQLATWQISQGTSPAILETGIYNLTQDVVYVQVTFPGGSVQNWTLVRVDDSPDDGIQ